MKYFCWIFPLTEEKWTCKVLFEISAVAHYIISAVSLTPQRSFQQCQWHRWNCFSSDQSHRGNRFSGVNDTTEIISAVSMTPFEIVSAVSMTPLKSFQRCHWHSAKKFCSPHEIFNFAITMTSAMSRTPLKSFQQCHWHRWNRFSGVNYTAEIVSAITMTPRKSFQRCHWHRCNSNNIDFLGEYEAICETALGRESGP
jgi:hypothetical protein